MSDQDRDVDRDRDCDVGWHGEPVAAPYRAVRWIRLVSFDGHGLLLASLTQPRCFQTVAQARCLAGGDHRAPQLECACGFYACADLAELEMVTETMGVTGVATLQLAEVSLWGKIVLHERGMRAEHQRVERITLGPAPCGHQPDGLVRMPTMLSVKAPEGVRPKRRATLCRAACSACEPVDMPVSRIGDELGIQVAFSETDLIARRGAELGGEQHLAMACALAATMWLVALIAVAFSSMLHAKVTASADAATVTMTPATDLLTETMFLGHVILAAPLATWQNRRGRGVGALGRAMLYGTIGMLTVAQVAMWSLPSRIGADELDRALGRVGMTVTARTVSGDGVTQLHARRSDGATCVGTFGRAGTEVDITWAACESPARTGTTATVGSSAQR